MKKFRMILKDDAFITSNGQIIAQIKTRSLKGNKFAQILWDMFVSCGATNDEAKTLVEWFDIAKFKNKLPVIYQQTAEFYDNKKGNIDYVQSLVDALAIINAEDTFPLVKEKVEEEEEYNIDTKPLEAIKITSGAYAARIGKNFGACIFGNNYSTGVDDYPGDESRKVEVCKSALQSSGNRTIWDLDEKGYQKESFTGEFENGTDNSCYYMLWDKVSPQEHNQKRFVLVFAKKGDQTRFKIWNDSDTILLEKSITQYEAKRAKEEGREPVARIHFNSSYPNQVRVLLNKLKAMPEFGITDEDLQEVNNRYNEKVSMLKNLKEISNNNSEDYSMTSYGSSGANEAERALEDPREVQRREKEKIQKRINEITIDINDSININFFNGFMTFKIQINQSLRSRNNMYNKLGNEFLCPLNDIIEGNDASKNINTTNEHSIIRLFEFIKEAYTKDLDSVENEGITYNEVPFECSVSMLLKPKESLFSKMLNLDTLSREELSGLNRSNEPLKYNEKEDILKICEKLTSKEFYKILSQDNIEKIKSRITKLFLIRPNYFDKDFYKKINYDQKDIAKVIEVFNKESSRVHTEFKKAINDNLKKINEEAEFFAFRFPEKLDLGNINVNYLDEKEITTNVNLNPIMGYIFEICKLYYNRKNRQKRDAMATYGKWTGKEKIDITPEELDTLHVNYANNLLEKGKTNFKGEFSLNDEEVNNIINGISEEQVEEINSQIENEIEENKALSTTTNENLENWKKLSDDNDLKHVNINECLFQDIKWANSYAINVSIIKKLNDNYESAKEFIETLKGNLNDVDKYLRDLGFKGEALNQLITRFTNNGIYSYLLNEIEETPEEITEEEIEEIKEPIEQQVEEVPNEETEIDEPEVIEEIEVDEPEVIEEIEVDEDEETPNEEDLIEETPNEEDNSFDAMTWNAIMNDFQDYLADYYRVEKEETQTFAYDIVEWFDNNKDITITGDVLLNMQSTLCEDIEDANDVANVLNDIIGDFN